MFYDDAAMSALRPKGVSKRPRNDRHIITQSIDLNL